MGQVPEIKLMYVCMYPLSTERWNYKHDQQCYEDNETNSTQCSAIDADFLAVQTGLRRLL